MMKHPFTFIFCISAVITLASFPEIDPVFGPGLDSGYFWAFNQFASSNQADIFSRLIFPIGPLGFLLAPFAVGNNLLFGLMILSLLKFIFVFLLLYRSYLSCGSRISFLFIPVAWLVSYAAVLEFSIAGILALLLLHHLEKPRLWLFAACAVAAAFGWYIKSFIGVICFSMIAMEMLLHARQRDFLKSTGIKSGIVLLTVYIAGIIVFKNLAAPALYFFNTLKVITAYSDALVLHVPNKFYLLLPSLALLILFPLFIKNREAWVLLFIFSMALFAAWKHSITRQDPSHYRSLFNLMIVFFGIGLSFSERLKFSQLLIPLLSVLLFYLNAKGMQSFEGFTYVRNGFSSFHKSCIHYSTWKKEAEENTMKQVSNNKVDSITGRLVGKGSVDIYPWDLTFIPANNFFYKPRITLQLLSLNKWYDHQTASGFQIKDGPDFVLFHFQPDVYGGNFGSIDQRFLLNDEPLAMQALFSNYQLNVANSRYMLLQKSEKIVFASPEIFRTDSTRWMQWLPVPAAGEGILKAHFQFQRTWLNNLKKFFYKDELFFVDYRFQDSSVNSYRFNPNVAENGLWVHPFPHDESNSECRTVGIRFRTTADNLFDEHLIIRWSAAKENREAESLLRFFKGGEKETKPPGWNFYSEYGYETGSPYWSEPGKDSTQKHWGNYCGVMNPNEFSATFKISTDSFPAGAEVQVTASAWINSRPGDELKLVISIEGDPETKRWEAVDSRNFPFANGEWNNLRIKRKLIIPAHSMLVIYALNSGDEPFPVYVDDLVIFIKE